ncbi:MAG: hypothetical protein PHP44_11910 [Kiritimatiellae bacterium]|nr:hypothetical protein [Kiritimatiellia bacterium]
MNGTVRNWILVVFCFVLAGLAGWQQIKIRELQGQCALLQQAAVERASALKPDARKAKALARLTGRDLADASEAQVDYREAVRSAVKEAVEASQKKDSNVMKQLAGMMDTPEMKEAIRLQQKSTMELMYGGLFSYLDLEGEERTAFEDLLLDRQMALMEQSFLGMSGDLTPEQRREQMAKAQTIREKYEAVIQGFLGADDYAVFQDYEQTQPERVQILQFKQSLSAGNTLTPNQEHELILSMKEARTNYAFTVDMAGLERDPSQLTEETLEGICRDFEQLNGLYEERAAAVLSEEQQEAFAAFLQQQLVMQRAGMKMALKMFSQPE